mmetsp:Transcript_47322/g.84654  ORF Transcript_47322/g.84654 Transcript_47322/m.84654 type:complete len:235 (+) Transcript_47322:154-858(+)
MDQRLLRGEPAVRVQLQQRVHEVGHGLAEQGPVPLLQRLGLLHLREAVAGEPGIVVEHLHLLVGQLAQHPLDHEQLVDLRVTREQGLPVQQLPHDASARPEVNPDVVGRAAEQQLRGAVPAGGHVVGVVGLRALLVQCTREAEVTQFQCVGVRVDKEVLQLDVPVDDVVAVAGLDSLKQLVHVLPTQLWVQPRRVFIQELQHVGSHELKDEVELPLPPEGLPQVDNVFPLPEQA